MRRAVFRTGECVVFRKWKRSTRPGSRAKCVYAAKNGETYVYCIEKVWRVVDVLADGKLLLKTNRGKVHRVDPSDSNLRKVTLRDRFRYRDRISSMQASA